MLYFFLIIPGLIVLYFIYYKVMIFKVTNMPLYYPPLTSMKSVGQQLVKFKNDGSFPFDAKIFRPSGHTGKLPCVVLFHGEVLDSMKPKPLDWKVFHDYGKLLSNMGFASVIFNHRSTKMGKTATPSREDLVDLLSYVNNNEDSLGIDCNRIIIWAYSGSVYSGLNWVIREKPEFIKGFISYYGVLAGKEENESAIRLMEESDGKSIPPLLIAKAEKDRVKSSIKAAEDFYKAGKEKADVSILRHPGPHGFDGFSKTEETIEVIDKTLDFIKDRFS